MRRAASPRSPSLQDPSTLPRYSSGCFHKAICHVIWHPGQESLILAVHTGRLELREVGDLPTVTQQLPSARLGPISSALWAPPSALCLSSPISCWARNSGPSESLTQ